MWEASRSTERVAGFDPDSGELISYAKVQNDSEALREVFGKLDEPLYGAMEIGTNAWAMYWTLLEFFEQLVVVDPLETWGSEGRRGATVHYHRPLSAYFAALEAAGLAVEKLREPAPSEEMLEQSPDWEHHLRIPSFLVARARVA